MRDRRPAILRKEAQNETRIGYTLVARKALLAARATLAWAQTDPRFPVF